MVTHACSVGRFPAAHALPLPSLAGTSRVEFWETHAPVVLHRDATCQVAVSGDWLFGALQTRELPEDLEDAVESAYRRVLAENRAHGHLHLLRTWNYLDRINHGPGDEERYRRFCIGRARAVNQRPVTGYAAATVIGKPEPSGVFDLFWLAAKEPGIPIENPRQVSAWEYPRTYGPVSPAFSRAMLVPGARPVLLVSGTASVVQHASVHTDLLDQVDETLRNLEAVVAVAAKQLSVASGLREGSLLRAYLRRPEMAEPVLRRLLARLGTSVRCMLWHGEICRSDLLVEIELAHSF